VPVGEQGRCDQAQGRIGADDGPPDRGPQVLPQASRRMAVGRVDRSSRRRGLDVDVRGGLLGRSGALDRDTRNACWSFSLPEVAPLRFTGHETVSPRSASHA
jgi:hypothetical protein